MGPASNPSGDVHFDGKYHTREFNKILVVVLRETGSRIQHGDTGMILEYVYLCVCVCHIGSMLGYSGASLLQPAKGTDQMDDQTLIIPSRPIPSKAVINFAELHQI